ncbi:mCG148067 [Mus musculus]|nr:mCG148067 [Mus musculus]
MRGSSPLLLRFWVKRAMWAKTHVEIRRQPGEVGFLFLPCGPRAGIDVISVSFECLKSHGLQQC